MLMGNCGPVLIVDDDKKVSHLISSLLRRAGFETIEAGNGDRALELAVDRRPAVAVVDVNLGHGRSGYEVSRELRDLFAGLPVVMISGERKEPFDRVAGLLLGAADYIVKPFSPDELIARVRRLVDDVAPEPAPAFARLTGRERDVLSLLARGQSQVEIASSLVLSPKTVATHIQHILAKLGVHSRAQAVAAAHRAGLDAEEDVVPHMVILS
jgi:DNA-binding NarL/FixJ family response regulator